MRVGFISLHGRPLRSVAAHAPLIARWVLFALAAVASVLLLLSAVRFYGQALALSPPPLFDPSTAAPQPNVLRTALQALGITPSVFAALLTMMYGLLGTTYLLIGWSLLIRGRHLAALITGVWLVLFGATFSPMSGTLYATSLGPLTLTLGNVAYASFFLLFYLFPDGRFTPRWTARAAGLLAAVWAVNAIWPEAWFNPERWGPYALPLYLTLVGTMLYAQHQKFHLATALQRRQTKWVATSLGVALLTFVGQDVVRAAVPAIRATPENRLLYDLLATVAVVSALLWIPVALAHAVSKQRLWDVPALVNRAAVYVVLSVMLAVTYALAIGLSSSVMGWENSQAGWLGAAVVAVLFAPLRARLQAGLNRLMYGQRDDPYAVLAQLSRRITSSSHPEEALHAGAESLQLSLRVPHVQVILQGEDRPTPPAAELFELTHHGQLVGIMHVERREPDVHFTNSERQLFLDAARHLSVVAHSALLWREAGQLAVDLQRSREHLVTSQEEERRRLRRDLHDGLGPTLASQALLLDAARANLSRNPERALALLDELSALMQRSVSEVRRVVYGLRPPALDELGLDGALREQAMALSHPHLSIQVQIPDSLPALPAAVEVAAFRIATEAVTNAVRHAHAQSITLTCRVKAGGSQLILEVTDDGVGLPLSVKTGVGWHSMRERAVELGGTCEFERQSQGLRVVASLPLPSRGTS